MIAHVGIDGSGKSYGMATSCAANYARQAKRKYGKEIWSIRPMEGSRRLEHPHQLMYLLVEEKDDHPGTIVFLDELQRYYPAGNYPLDELTQHIISTHRHGKMTIHWASQDWFYVHKFWRLETSHCWRYEARFRNPETGESRIRLHRRTLVTGTDMELGRRRPDILKKEGFWITKKGVSRFNSYERIDVVPRKLTQEYIASIKDPRSDFILSPDEAIDQQAEPEAENRSLNEERESDHPTDEIEREQHTEHLDRAIE